MRHYKLTLIFISLLTPFSCTFANPPTGHELIQILLENQHRIIPNNDGWCNGAANKPLSSEIIRVLSPRTKFEDDLQEDLHYQCTDSVHESNGQEISVWQCQLGVVETKDKDKKYFISRSIFISINKDLKNIFIDSLRCMN